MKNVNEMSEQEVVNELSNFGIKIVYKPVAILQNDISTFGFSESTFEHDIYETLQKIRNRTMLNTEPFKD